MIRIVVILHPITFTFLSGRDFISAGFYLKGFSVISALTATAYSDILWVSIAMGAIQNCFSNKPFKGIVQGTISSRKDLDQCNFFKDS